MNPLIIRATQRAERNDAHEMVRSEEYRLAGLKPAERVRIAMDGELEPLGDVAWNRRSDLISAAPDVE